MSTPLTEKRLQAICEALGAKLAGEINVGEGDYPREDYEATLRWANDKLRDKELRKQSR